MLKPSRTWPYILQKTMAVVQLRFDGKYAYSTIADINQPHIIENQISITSERRRRVVEGGETEEEEEENSHDNKQEAECICEHKKDLHERCRSMYNGVSGNCRQQNGHHHLSLSSPMNGHTNCAPSSPPSIKFCICNFHSANNHHRHHNNNNNSDKNRQRSESIKVENWDFIYRERAFLDVTHTDHNVAVPK